MPYMTYTNEDGEPIGQDYIYGDEDELRSYDYQDDFIEDDDEDDVAWPGEELVVAYPYGDPVGGYE